MGRGLVQKEANIQGQEGKGTALGDQGVSHGMAYKDAERRNRPVRVCV